MFGMNMKIVFIVFYISFNTKAKGYFGLTGKEQLHNLWSINLKSAMLTTSVDDELQPSQEYDPVDLSPKPDPPIAVKTKRVAARPEETKSPQYRTYSTRHTGSRYPSSAKLPINTGNERNSYHNQQSITQNDGRQNSRYQSQKSTRKSTQRKGYNNRRLQNVHATQSRHLTEDIQQAAHRTYTPTTRQENAERQARLSYSISQGKRLSSYTELLDSAKIDMSRVKFANYSRRNMAYIMQQTSRPHVRSERESGKRWAILPHYLVASSFNPRTPSQVEIGSDIERQPISDLGTRRNVDLNSNNNHSRDQSLAFSEPFLGLDEKSFKLYSSFIENRMGNATMLEPEKINRNVAKKLCDTFKLTDNQRKKCRRDPGLPQVLTEATHIAAAECQYQFRYEKWNCSLGKSRIHLLNKGNKETAFLYAISSAGLTHSVARACANGHLEKCSCEESFEDHLNHEAWMWGGCGDNVRYAAKFVRRFLKSRSSSMDIRAEVDKHNSDLGIRVVKSNVKQTCKCHGVSGSCTTKTCWRKLAPFYEIGKKVKRAYDRGVKVSSINNSNGRARLVRLRQRSRSRRQKSSTNRLSEQVTSTSSPSKRQSQSSSTRTNSRIITGNTKRNQRRMPASQIRSLSENELDDMPRKKELVFLEKSPHYCRKSALSLGTKGRICEDESNCKMMCCGRGFTTHIKIIRKSCDCEVKWCCQVKCITCTERQFIHTCK